MEKILCSLNCLFRHKEKKQGKAAIGIDTKFNDKD